MLVAYNGNDSAKQILRRGKTADGSVGEVVENLDNRSGGGDYFLSRETVDKWSKENLDMHTVSFLLTFCC